MAFTFNLGTRIKNVGGGAPAFTNVKSSLFNGVDEFAHNSLLTSFVPPVSSTVIASLRLDSSDVTGSLDLSTLTAVTLYSVSKYSV